MLLKGFLGCIPAQQHFHLARWACHPSVAKALLSSPGSPLPLSEPQTIQLQWQNKHHYFTKQPSLAISHLINTTTKIDMLVMWHLGSMQTDCRKETEPATCHRPCSQRSSPRHPEVNTGIPKCPIYCMVYIV